MVTQRGFLLNLGLLACVLLIVFCCWNARSLQNKGERQHQQQEQRKALLRNICHHYKEGFSGGKYSLDSLSLKDMDNLLVDDKYGIIYCYIPKVACTNWKKVMMALKHEEPLPDPRSIHDELTNMRDLLNPLNSFSRTEIKIKMKHYTKFMFVRDPFVRLVSTYREKFLRHSEYFFYNYAWDILRRYDARPDLPKSADEAFGAGLKPSFSSFIHYLVDPQTEKSGPFEPHWRQYYQLCHPCVIEYDFIGHQETLNEDAEELLEMLHLKNDIKFPPAYVNVTSPDSIKKWFEGVPLATKKKLFKIYETDFKLFGYNQPDYLISE